MPGFVVLLHQNVQLDPATIGGKATPLATLAAAGFPVPTSLCVTTAAFHLALADRQPQIDLILDEYDPRQPAMSDVAAQRIELLLADLRVPAPVVAALDSTLPHLDVGEAGVAVRSSATAEDGTDASFAGQYATRLGVHGRDKILAAVVACWRSFFTRHALAARANHRDLRNDDAMAVLIMPMVEAECAGVCFSIDPIRSRRSHIVVDATWGLGASVVDGSLPTDTAWIRRRGFQIERHEVVEKPARMALDGQGGIRRESVPLHQQRIACTPASWLRRVAQYGVAAELQFGAPQDVEWAIAAGQIWILQSRPITALPPHLAHPSAFPVARQCDDDRRRLWTLTHPEGRERDVLLPLELDALSIVEDVRVETCRLVGAERNQRVQVCNGRVYTTPVPMDWSAGERRVRRAAKEDLKERLHQQGLTAWDYWGPEIERATERLRAFDPVAAEDAALADHLEEAIAVRRRHYMLHPLCWFKPSPAYLTAFEAVSDKSGPAAEAAAYALLDGEETPLTRLVDALFELAQLARRAPAVIALITDPPDDVVDRLATLPQAASFRARLDEILAVYGERTGNGYGSEATIATPTWREHPQAVLCLLAPYLDAHVTPPALARQRAGQAREAQVASLCRACNDVDLVARFRRELDYARKTTAVLEIHNHYIDQMSVGQLRHAALAAADRLVEREVLSTQADVFWLTFDEILSALRADAPLALADLIAGRRQQYAAWRQLEAPPILGVPDAHLPERPEQQDEWEQIRDESGEIVGLGAVPGRCRGRARVVPASTQHPLLEPGEILVAENAGPRWTPLFPILGGLVLDGGSLGQHAVAIAREYGVPTVIRTGRATGSIPDGVWVTVDGLAGTVSLEEEPA